MLNFDQAKNHLKITLARVISVEATLVLTIGIAVLLVEIFHLVFLTTYPPVFIDESWYANTAWNWLNNGVNFDSMHAGALDQLGYEWVRWPYIGNAVWVASFAILGLGLLQARLVSWVFGLILLMAIFWVGRRAYGLVSGAVTILLLSLSPVFLQASHYARPDIMVAAVIMIAYGLALFALEKNKWWAHLLAGLLLGSTLDIHQNGILFIPGLAVMYLVVYKKALFRRPGTWLCAGGGLLGVAYYVAFHIAPNPAAYFALFDLAFGKTHQPPLSFLNPLQLLSSARDEVGRYHFYENSLDFALIGAGVVYLAVRRTKADQLLLAFAGLAFAAFIMFVGNKHDIYAVLLYPFFMLIVAELLVSLVRTVQQAKAQRAFAIALLLLALFNGVMHLTRPILSNRGYDYYAVTNKIREAVPPQARVMGLPNWWLGLSDYDYRSSMSISYYHYQNGYTLTQGLEVIRPDVLILDTGLQGLLTDEGYFPEGAGFGFYRLPRQELMDFLAQRGEKVSEFWDSWHGNFEIYVIHWN